MKIVIIGNGIAGTSVARALRKLSSHEITLISEETDYFFSRTALMYVYMGQMKFEHTQPYEKDFWAKNRLQLLKKTVTSVDTQAKCVIFNDGNRLSYDVLVLATGSLPNKFGWKGQDLKGVQGLYFKQDLEQMELFSKDLKQAVVVGGGLIGIEMAEMFHARHIPVTFLVRENSFWNTVLPQEESEMINRHIRLQKGITLRLGEELAEIEGDEKGQVQTITTKKGEKIPCQFVGLTVGVSPNVAFLKNTNIEIDKGILVDEYLQTNLPDVYAVGDCAQLRQPAAHRKSIEAVWYTGKLMAPILAKTICKEKTKYVQGVWFNSAKFFDIEYQVYGEISPTLQAHETHIYWEHSDGKKAIRIVYDTINLNVLGFNLMGIRYRQEICEQWILQKTNIEVVLKNLSQANFDPEFFKKYEGELLKSYQNK